MQQLYLLVIVVAHGMYSNKKMALNLWPLGASTFAAMEHSHHIKAQLAAGNTSEVFNMLVEQYASPLYQHIRTIVRNHEDTDDVLQNTFLKVWKGLSDFRGEAALYTWLYRIATNEALNHLRKNRRNSGFDVHGLLEPSETPGPTATEIQKHFEAALLQLPPKQAIVFRMRYFDALPFAQISEILGTSVGGLKASYHHAANKIVLALQQALNY